MCSIPLRTNYTRYNKKKLSVERNTYTLNLNLKLSRNELSHFRCNTGCKNILKFFGLLMTRYELKHVAR
jgi:hypothetical protein